ncbi:MAG: PAS domain-containing protein [bacterium]|nr:PAS domain-containing protein [bacterium]
MSIEEYTGNSLPANDRESLNTLCRGFARLTGCVSVFVDNRGTALTDLEGDEALGARFARECLAAELDRLREAPPSASELRPCSAGLVISVVPIGRGRQAVVFWLVAIRVATEQDRGDQDPELPFQPSAELRGLVAHQQECASLVARSLAARDELAEEQRRAREVEAELRSSREALAEANMMFQLVVDTIPVRVFWKDAELNYLGCNRLFAQDAGLDRPEELIGKNDYDMTWRNQAELYREDDRKVIEREERRVDYEEPQTTPSGETWRRQTPRRRGKALNGSTTRQSRWASCSKISSRYRASASSSMRRRMSTFGI